jgi:hypothetical protein
MSQLISGNPENIKGSIPFLLQSNHNFNRILPHMNCILIKPKILDPLWSMALQNPKIRFEILKSMEDVKLFLEFMIRIHNFEKFNHIVKLPFLNREVDLRHFNV